MKKLRMKNWYWGKYVESPLHNTNLSDYEEYIEEIHGWHHSEEYKKSKILIFEGAGWSGADSSKASDVGNCRIRATFLNKQGKQIYIELNGTIPHKWSPEYMKGFKVGGWVAHCFESSNEDKSPLRNLEGTNFEYCKKSILQLLNSREIGGDFTDIEVREDWNGFSVDGVGNEKFK